MLGMVFWVRVWKVVMEGGGVERLWWRVVEERVCLCVFLSVSVDIYICRPACVCVCVCMGGGRWRRMVE